MKLSRYNQVYAKLERPGDIWAELYISLQGEASKVSFHKVALLRGFRGLSPNLRAQIADRPPRELQPADPEDRGQEPVVSLPLGLDGCLWSR